MTRAKYALLIALPALIICNPVGKAAKTIELAARRVRIKCLRRMQKVMAGVPDA
ncbi:hypothetical protein QE443_002665 [Pantoea ananatis]|nr:hypothetical protein [Pantoea ananatis]MDR6088382.1 hypothetical protein [Pantoea ananatis]